MKKGHTNRFVANCLSTFYDSSVTNGGVNCILYDYYDSALQNADATSTYAFQTCTQWSTTYASEFLFYNSTPCAC